MNANQAKIIYAKDRVREQYGRLAGKYDLRWRGYISSTLGFLKNWMDMKGSEKVLDVACGTGTLEQMLVKDHPNMDISGVDFSEEMLEIARQKLSTHPNVVFLNAKSSALPFPAESFDHVICANAFHFFENSTTSLIEMKRVLRAGGDMIILDWCRDDFICCLCDLYLKIVDPAHRRCYRQRELNRFLAEAGLNIVREKRFKAGLIWGMMMVQAVRGQG